MVKCSNLRGLAYPVKKLLELELLMFTSPAVLLEQTCNGRQVILGYSWVRGWLVFGRGNPWR